MEPCCVVVWENWLAETKDRSFAAFLEGPLREFFLSQSVFEATGAWPFGERPHGTAGMLEGYAEVLGVKPEVNIIHAWLAPLAKPILNERRVCPCGSGNSIKDCHGEEIWSLRQRVPTSLARQMQSKLDEASEKDRLNRLQFEDLVDAILQSLYCRRPINLISASQSALKLGSSPMLLGRGVGLAS